MKTDIPCHGVQLRRAAQHVTRTYDKALSESGLKLTQFSLLANIQKLEGPNLVDLATAMGLDRSTLGRNVRVLARSGHVELVGGDDERTTIVELTSKGAKVLSRARPQWLDAQRAVEDALGEDGQVMMRTLLGRLAKLEA